MAQKIVDLLLNGHGDIIDAIQSQTQAMHLMHSETTNSIVAEGAATRQEISTTTSDIQEQASREHAQTRDLIRSQAAAIEDHFIAEHKETRDTIMNSGADGVVILERITDHILELREELRREHVVEQEKSRDDLKSWISALMVQNSMVLEAHQAAVDAANRANSGRSQPIAKSALERARDALDQDTKILMEVAEIFERVSISVSSESECD